VRLSTKEMCKGRDREELALSSGVAPEPSALCLRMLSVTQVCKNGNILASSNRAACLNKVIAVPLVRTSTVIINVQHQKAIEWLGLERTLKMIEP